MNEPRQTPLHAFHASLGARFVPFSGWDMPVQYRSILDEHRAVRSAAGLFDASHMGEADVKGPGATAFLDSLVTNDVSKMAPGRALYTPMCNPEGGVVDDLIIYCRAPGDYLLCLNAGNTAEDLAWLHAHAAGRDVAITDRSDEYGLLALQGPRSVDILAPLCSCDIALIRYYHFATGAVAGVPCIISRTGYTGEDGFELFCPAGEAPALAAKLLEAGAPHGLVPAGLGARDSLRLEAGYPLHGHEISPSITPVEAGLGWTVKTDKASGFTGRPVLERQKREGCARRIVFFRTGNRRIVRGGSPVFSAGAAVGEVVSGTLSPGLNEGIGSALVAAAAAGAPLTADLRGETIFLRTVKPPFVPLPPKH